MSNYIKEILVVGAGNMAVQYAKVLAEFDIVPTVIGHSREGANLFFDKTGIRAIEGGVEIALDRIKSVPDYAIVATNENRLISSTKLLIDRGIRNILIEKPVGINYREVKKLADYATAHDVNAYVAYNRRFLSSVDKTMKIIDEDGGVSSFHFEFTEWQERVKPGAMKREKEYREAWLILNSSHVIDLAFFLGGYPEKLSHYKNGALDWHEKGSAYVGAGITQKGALFSYNANWDSAGRWGIEVMTKKHRLILKPIEELYIQDKNSVNIYKANIDDSIDKEFKPGLYRQIESFINDLDDGKKITLGEHATNMRIYETIEGELEIS